MKSKETIDWDARRCQFLAACGKEGPGKAAQRAAGLASSRGESFRSVTPEGKALGEIARRRRLEMMLTQLCLGAKAGCGQKTVAQLEAGRLPPNSPTAQAVLRVLGLAEEGRAA